MKNKILKRLNTLEFKLISLFSVLIIFTTIITLTFINLSARNFRNNPQPNIEFLQTPGPYNNFELREQIRQKILEDRKRSEDLLLLVTIFLVLTQIFVATLGSVVIVRRSLDPLTKLRKAMSEISSLDLKSKIIKNNDSYSEMKELIEAFNSMIERIEQMIQKEKSFIQNISHELKTPISATRLNIESVLIDKNINKEDKETLRIALDSIDMLNRLIDDLTLISSVENKNYRIESFDTIKAIEESIQEVKTLYPEVDILLLQTGNLKNFKIKGSNILFKRAIANLIENGCKYGGSEIRVHIAKNNNKLNMTVEDNGVGIPKESIDKIFDRFYRVDNSRSRKTGGSGLGLAITKEIIEFMNGKISVDSSINKGSKFFIQFIQSS